MVFVCLVGVALAGGSPDPSVSGGSCQGRVAAAPKASCQGEAKAEEGCHGSSSKKATRKTMAQRRADRQSGRQEARSDRASARSASSGCHGSAKQSAAASCHGSAKAAPVAAACDCGCDCGDAQGCEGCSADCASRQ